MATLTNEKIKLTYAGLIKTNDSGAIGAVEKEITDGVGTASTLKLGTTSASFVGTLDLTGATVTGLPPGEAGLVAGTGADSMKSADSLTTTAANASGLESIAIGNAAVSASPKAIAIGARANIPASQDNAIVIGSDSFSRNSGVSVGNSIANNAQIGGTAIGHDSGTGSAFYATAIGYGATANAQGSTALGALVTAAIADTVSMKALEVQTNSTPTAGGIIMADAGGTDRRINIDAAGALQIDSTPVGGGAASFSTTTKVTTTITGGDTLLYEITIPGNTFTAGDIIETFGMVSNDFTGGGTIYGNCFLAPVAGATGANGIQLASNATSTSAGYSTKRTIIIHTADGTGDGTSIPGIDNANNANDYQTGLYTWPDNNTKAIDWTQTQYFKFYTWIDNAGSSSTLHGMYIKKVN